jgi:hypothetical protein
MTKNKGGQPKGTKLDGVASIEELKGRCVVDEITGCWHYRTARGKPMRRGFRHAVFMHTTQSGMSVPKASWLLSHPGETLKSGWICFRKCESYDCANPEHITRGTRKAHGAHMAASGKAVTPAKTAANKRMGPVHPRRKLNDELRQWAAESTQSATEAGHGLGVVHQLVSRIRRSARAAQSGWMAGLLRGVA